MLWLRILWYTTDLDCIIDRRLFLCLDGSPIQSSNVKKIMCLVCDRWTQINSCILNPPKMAFWKAQWGHSTFLLIAVKIKDEISDQKAQDVIFKRRLNWILILSFWCLSKIHNQKWWIIFDLVINFSTLSHCLDCIQHCSNHAPFCFLSETPRIKNPF